MNRRILEELRDAEKARERLRGELDAAEDQLRREAEAHQREMATVMALLKEERKRFEHLLEQFTGHVKIEKEAAPIGGQAIATAQPAPVPDEFPAVITKAINKMTARLPVGSRSTTRRMLTQFARARLEEDPGNADDIAREIIVGEDFSDFATGSAN